MDNLGKRIRTARENANFSQDGLGDSIKRSRSLIAQYEAGTTIPPVESVINISKATGVTISYLLGETDDLGSIAEPIPRLKLPPAPDIAEWMESMSKGIFEIKELLVKTNARDSNHKNKIVPFPARPYRVLELSEPIGAGRVGLHHITEADVIGEIIVKLPERADVAVRVRGDSMSPLIADGAMVYIKKCSAKEIQDGEIAVCYFFAEEEWMLRRVYQEKDSGESLYLLESEKTGETKAYNNQQVDLQGKVVGWENDPEKVREIMGKANEEE